MTAQEIAQLVAQTLAQMNLAVQQPAQAPAPGPPPAGPSMVSRPREFDGGDDYEHFRRECQLFMAENPSSFATGDRKISFILSYLKSGRAAAWAQNYIDSHTTNNVITLPTDFDDFLASLDASFKDPTKAAKAMERFYKSKQGNRSAEDFFVEFDQILIAAGLTKSDHDGIIIEQLKKAVHEDVFRGVARSNPVPTTYTAWKKTAKEIDVVEESIRKNKAERLGTQTRAPPRLPIPQAAFQPPPGPPPAFAPRDHQGVRPGTHPGRGIPMDVDINALRREGRCYKCREQGHIARNCPLKNESKGIFQRFLHAMDPEDLAIIGEIVAEMPESVSN